MPSLVVPKVGELWKRKPNSSNENYTLRITHVHKDLDACSATRSDDDINFIVNYSVSILNEFFIPPLNAKLDILLGD